MLKGYRSGPTEITVCRMDKVEPLYFLTLITLLVILLTFATVQAVRKRRSRE